MDFEKDKPKPKNEHETAKGALMVDRGLRTETSLMDAFQFSFADLQANRDGYLTKAQRVRLNRDRRDCKIATAVSLLAIPIGTILILLRMQTPTMIAFIFIGVLWMVALVSAAYFWTKKVAYDDDLHKGDVVRVEGPVRVASRMMRQVRYMNNSDPNFYYFAVSDQRWNASDAACAAFRAGDTYIIYYTPYTNTVLSVEWLGEG